MKLETDPTKGLGSEDAAERLKTNGPNSLTPPKQTPVWLHLLKDMFGGFSILLWMGSVASFVAYGMERHERGADAPQDNVRRDSDLSVSENYFLTFVVRH